MLLLEPKCWALSWSLGLRLSWLQRFIVYFLETSITRHQAQGSKYAVKWVWDPIGGNGVTCFLDFLLEWRLKLSFKCYSMNAVTRFFIGLMKLSGQPYNSYSLFIHKIFITGLIHSNSYRVYFGGCNFTQYSSVRLINLFLIPSIFLIY